jgi:hypothetical protein
MTRLDLSQLTVAPGPYRSDGRVVKALDGGRWHPIAYCDSNGYLSAYSERDTAHLLAASPALVAALRDAYAEIDRLRAAIVPAQEMIAELMNTCDNDQADTADLVLQGICDALAQGEAP